MSAYRHTEGALWHTTSRRVLVNPPEGATFDLDGVAGLVWEALDEPVTIDDLAADLAAVFDRPVEEVGPEVARVVAELVAAGAASPA
ncbi:MAG TPA: PqqD family protein [Acidimicrobiales bacterium]|nr:PqqD family protein [Acidimicrobiales bacterium]